VLTFETVPYTSRLCRPASVGAVSDTDFSGQLFEKDLDIIISLSRITAIACPPYRIARLDIHFNK
jgi:hypothetical protein